MRKIFARVIVISALVIAILATGLVVALAQSGTCVVTGGGTVGNSETRIGVALSSDVNNRTNQLNVSWGKGNSFQLKELTFAECFDDPAIEPNPPDAACDSYHGIGVGKYRGVDGYTAEWVFTDAGEPGRNDWAWVKITAPGGTEVLEQSGFLMFGNLQFLNSE
jgi:hypothetical protein